MTVPGQIAQAFPKRPLDAHKYSAGVVAVLGGSDRFSHAPVIAGLGARSGGAGLVQLIVPDASRAAAGALLPEATFSLSERELVPPRTDVMAVGMGMGVSQDSERLVSELVLENAGRFVVDADALTILAAIRGRDPQVVATGDRVLVLTPHVGEAARLLSVTSEDVQGNREEAVRGIADRYHAVTVLKGRHTLVAAPGGEDLFRCEAGNPFMAMGGMGDLLSGILAARWAYLAKQKPELPPVKMACLAACAAVWLHAKASDIIVQADPPGDPSIVNTARMVSSLRVQLERG